MGTKIVKGYEVRFRASATESEAPQDYVIRITCQVLDTNGADGVYNVTDEIIGELFGLEAVLRTLQADGGLIPDIHFIENISVNHFEEVTTTSQEPVEFTLYTPPEEPTP